MTSRVNHLLSPAAAGGRRKGAVSRSWLVISTSGETFSEEVDKQSLMRRTGLPARDLRIVDLMLTYPSTILGRERAIVINLEHIKAVIMATEVLVPNSTSPLVGPFVLELQARVSVPEKATEFDDTGKENAEKVHPNGEMGGRHGTPSKVGKDGAEVLPFEFRALEVCLESGCRCLESETLTLEKEAYPVLDELTSKISTANLDRVRQIKSRLVAITGRVQKVRDELEHLLDDDVDVSEMYLTEKLTSQRADETSSRGDLPNDDSEIDDEREDELKTDTESNHGSYHRFKPNNEELEMLLDAYFMWIDGCLNKLTTLREYVDDTEDYVNIMLDEKQNQLLQMGVILNTFNIVSSVGCLVTSIMGINIPINLFSSPPTQKFWEFASGLVGGCVALSVFAVGCGKKSGLLK